MIIVHHWYDEESWPAMECNANPPDVALGGESSNGGTYGRQIVGNMTVRGNRTLKVEVK